MKYGFGGVGTPTILPSEPTNLQVVSDSDTQVTISWDASIAGDFPIVEYEVIANDALIGSTPTLSYPWDSVPPNQAIDYKVRAVDNQGNRSAFSDIVSYTNVVPQTGVDTTTGQVDIAFTDATNTVYWDGTQYIQEVVVDTPIAAASPIYISFETDTNPIAKPVGVEINSMPRLGSPLVELVDIDGSPTDFTCQATVISNGENNAGAITGDNSGCMTDYQLEQSHLANAGLTGTFTITVYFPAGTYNVSISSCRDSAADDRVGTFKLGALAELELSACSVASGGNTSECVGWQGVTSAGESIDLVVGIAAGSTFSYLNGMNITPV